MRSFKMTLILGVLIVLMVFVLSFETIAAEVYNWKMATAEVVGMPMTIFAERYAKLVEEKSDGRIKIEIFPFGTLGENRDVVELVQMGQIELGSIDVGWAGGFVPQVQLFSLNYLFPKENLPEVLTEICKNGQSVRLLGEKFREKGFQLLNVWGHGYLYFISNHEMLSLKDFQGKKHRVMGSPIMLDTYNNYGFSALTLGYGELYQALQSNMIDSFHNSIPSIYHMAFFEVGDYIFNAFNEPFLCVPVINRDLYDSLPQDLQKIIIDSAVELIEPMTSYCFDIEDEMKAQIKKEKPSITIYDLGVEEIEELRERAWQESGAANTYLEIGGEGAKEILDALIDDIKNAENKFQ